MTKPYSTEQWSAIVSLGHKVDADLHRLDVRLTQGGEPTFVATDDPNGAEWNTDALGATKRLRAAGLFHRLREKYAPQGLVHFGQGKWYPGEQLPRWSLNCFWRRDLDPIWHDPALIADEKIHGRANSTVGEAFLAEVAARLALDAGHVFPAYEDLFYYMWRERRLPDNVDDIKDRARDTYDTASYRVSRATDALRGNEESHMAGKVGALLIGVGIGVGVGLLIAPTTGEETRADIANKVMDFGDKVREATGKKPQAATGTYGE